MDESKQAESKDPLDKALDKLAALYEEAIKPPPHEAARMAMNKVVCDQQNYERALEDTEFASNWKIMDPAGFERAHQAYWSPAAVKARMKR